MDADADPCSIMMDIALYGEGNPIMDWLCNSMSESRPLFDEYDDNDLESPTPSTLLIEELGVSREELTAIKINRKNLEEDEEDIGDDYESDSPQGSPIYAESGDNSSNDESLYDDVGGDGDGARARGASGDGASGFGASLKEPIHIRPRSTRLKRKPVRSLYEYIDAGLQGGTMCHALYWFMCLC